jgi:excisionase family DNA binding protein
MTPGNCRQEAAHTAGPGGAPAAPSAGSGSQGEHTAPAPPRRPERRGAPCSAPTESLAPPLLPPRCPAGQPSLDFTAGSRCPPPDVDRTPRGSSGGSAGSPTNTGQRDQPRLPASPWAGALPSRHETVLASDAERLLLTKEEAARGLAISVRQLSRFIADGSLTPVRLGPRLVRFAPDDLVRFIARRSQTPQRPAWPERLPRHGL